MIKTYRKTATIQAEQFDGSAEMIEKYKISYPDNPFSDGNEDSFVIKTIEGNMKFKLGDWIATGVKGEHWSIADDVFKASYVEVTK